MKKKNKRKNKIALICNIGFASEWHPFGISLLKENLQRRTDIIVTNHYLCSEFTYYINRYYSHLREINADIGEIDSAYHEAFFSAKLFNHDTSENLIRKIADSNNETLPVENEYFITCVLEYCCLIDRFLQNKVKNIDWNKYQLIGFSCLSTQLLISAYMAQQLRSTGYRGTIIFGGDGFRKWNIAQYRNLFPFIDDIICGDGFNAIARQIQLDGYHIRINSCNCQYHFGDFSDMPSRVFKSPLFYVPVQLSQGCSWGKCNFCGIIHRKRKKPSIDSLVEWMNDITSRYEISDYGFVDCDLNGNMFAFNELCNHLKNSEWAYSIYGMLNPQNLTKQLCINMKCAGFSDVQLGIENFSNKMLLFLGKRNRVSDNIKALKWLKEVKVENVCFNIIINYPGEDETTIEDNLANIKVIKHLLARNKNIDLVEFDLERNSKTYRMKKLLHFRRFSNFQYDEICYPSKIVSNLRFHSVEYSHDSNADRWADIQKVLHQNKNAQLRLVFKRDKVVVYDTREYQRKYTLTKDQKIVYIYICNNLATFEEILKKVNVAKKQLYKILDMFIAQKLALKDNSRYLGLATCESKRSTGSILGHPVET